MLTTRTWSVQQRAVSTFACLLAALVLFPTDADACSCSNTRTFMEVAPYQGLVVAGKVVRHGGGTRVKLWMDVRIERVLLGKHTAKTVRVWGDNGVMCRPYVSGFPVNTRWVLALGERGKQTMISVCGEFWLPLKGKLAISKRTKTKTSLDDLEKALRKKHKKR